MTHHRSIPESIDPALLREGALELLASSTITRYEREARRLARESGLVHRLRANAELRTRVHTRLLDLLDDVSSQPLRLPSEFEAAILLCVWVELDLDGAHDVLRRASGSASPWIRMLAARLMAPISGDEARACAQ
jgi:hypothetical protein